MEVKKLNPITPGQRHQITFFKNVLSKNSLIIKNLVRDFKRKKGRCLSLGLITVRHIGGGCKNLYRMINFGNFWGKFIIVSNYYDPYRSSFVSLVFDLIDKKFDLFLMTEFVYAGTFVLHTFERNLSDLKLGYRTWLVNIPVGSFIHNLSVKPLVRAKYIRSAGSRGQIIQKSLLELKVRLSSGSIITIPNSAVGTLGSNSNIQNKHIAIGKAGRLRLMGKRPSVRGIAMNPVDHPHGGKGNGGRAVTPWAKNTRGRSTSRKV
jgi:large subunit ribosomal protein L2